MSFEFVQKLPTPAEIKELFPLPVHLAAIKAEKDKEIRKIFTGRRFGRFSPEKAINFW